MSFLKKVKTKRKKRISLKFTYQFDDIDIEKNETTNEIYNVETIENNKIFKKNQISKKLYSESNLYYFIRWKNYEKRIWKSISMIKHLKNMLRKFHTKNSKKKRCQQIDKQTTCSTSNKCNFFVETIDQKTKSLIRCCLLSKVYDAWKIESCQNYFQKLLFDLIER